MSFHLGKPILVMLCLSIVSGSAIFMRRAPHSADVNLWLFADGHARMYRDPTKQADGTRSPSLVDQFRVVTGRSVNVNLIAGKALDVRLMSLFMSGDNDGTRTPDLAEIEIGSVGKFFRPPTAQVGFLPLNDYLKKSGWMDRIVPSRLAQWSKDGQIFGVPHDLHPTTLSYRKDLFDQAGVELDSVKTWPEFQSRCLEFQRYWAGKGHRRYAIGLSTTSADTIMLLLLQRHINLIDSDLSLHLTDEKVADTMAWYAQAVAGPNQIGTDFNPAPGQNIRDLDQRPSLFLVIFPQ